MAHGLISGFKTVVVGGDLAVAMIGVVHFNVTFGSIRTQRDSAKIFVGAFGLFQMVFNITVKVSLTFWTGWLKTYSDNVVVGRRI